jgi:hypothetical protein
LLAGQIPQLNAEYPLLAKANTIFSKSLLLRCPVYPGRALHPISLETREPFTCTTAVRLSANALYPGMNLVENNLLGLTTGLSIWQTVASSNQPPQHYAFNESAKPHACPIER